MNATYTREAEIVNDRKESMQAETAERQAYRQTKNIH
jgi:hypothetical protein